MFKKIAISMGKQYLFEILAIWFSEKGTVIGKQDAKNLEKFIKLASAVLAANSGMTTLDVALLTELGESKNV